MLLTGEIKELSTMSKTNWLVDLAGPSPLWLLLKLPISLKLENSRSFLNSNWLTVTLNLKVAMVVWSLGLSSTQRKMVLNSNKVTHMLEKLRLAM